ncbi:hypothetical protein C9928_00745 [Pseudidiomarina aestuarii]|uniref:Uncharacterized protein n=1 Tax=Pseudidiomarina aestuarii TaxID=624146 RepID=A0A2T4D915_9GAMM|nr:hypothetical protein C9988_04035 [Pseudidiomarina aestuarii]PTB87277.1 hypothetical protein C9939_01905 [Pseudidiomarina aestuarii]PTB90280.1 hypothetical protein C9928_00745 [Pseudidiomarina aestuarii]
MTAKPLYQLVTLALALTVLITLGTSIFALVMPLLDEQLLTTWQVVFDESSVTTVVSEQGWALASNQGQLSIETNSFGFALSRAVTILLIGGLIIHTLCWLREFIGTLSTGRPFQQNTPTLLKRVGVTLLVISAVLYLEVFARFYLFIPNATDIAEFAFIYLKVSTSEGVFFIYPNVQWGLIVGGLFVLAIAQAFSLGVTIQTENDEFI